MSNPSPERIDHPEAWMTDLVIRLILLGLFAHLSLTLIRPVLPILVWAVVPAICWRLCGAFRLL